MPKIKQPEKNLRMRPNRGCSHTLDCRPKPHPLERWGGRNSFLRRHLFWPAGIIPWLSLARAHGLSRAIDAGFPGHSSIQKVGLARKEACPSWLLAEGLELSNPLLPPAFFSPAGSSLVPI